VRHCSVGGRATASIAPRHPLGPQRQEGARAPNRHARRTKTKQKGPRERISYEESRDILTDYQDRHEVENLP
jgi:hypothetical protein